MIRWDVDVIRLAEIAEAHETRGTHHCECKLCVLWHWFDPYGEVTRQATAEALR